ncbi:cell death protein hid-like isoform X1 [Rhagoletis pomonella]|uniref:cell death protein hid-like isoform X1 n=1 Tax=Rhagoletis pomonella TaxID=28610 RepID=UPI0017816DE9|nr:cell death protein hid-like isoform X1 [Rhagoletis pomonella]
MAVVFYMPEAGADDSASSGGHGSAGSGSAASSTSQSPNTTTSATQTPMQSPLLTSPHIVMALCEAVYQSWNTQRMLIKHHICVQCRGIEKCMSQRNSELLPYTPAFQYPPPASPCCHVHSPSPFTTGSVGGGGGGGGEVFFPHNRSTPRTPRTSVSFAAGEETTFFRHHNVSGGCSSSAPHLQPPQSAPPMPPSSHAGAHSQTAPQQYQQYSYPHYQYTPPPTPLTANASTSTSTCTGTGNMFGSTEATTHQRTCVASTSTSTPSCSSKGHARLHRSFSDAQKRSRRTSTANDDERECHSEHETSWDEFDDRYENFTAGRERLQEFNGRIPPRKKKKDVPKSKSEKKQFKSFIWPTVVTVIVVAMGCGFLVAR